MSNVQLRMANDPADYWQQIRWEQPAKIGEALRWHIARTQAIKLPPSDQYAFLGADKDGCDKDDARMEWEANTITLKNLNGVDYMGRATFEVDLTKAGFADRYTEGKIDVYIPTYPDSVLINIVNA